MFVSVGSFLVSEVDIVLVSYFSAIFTAIFQFLSVCATFPVAPQRGPARSDSAILLIGLYLGWHHGCDNNQVV
jgi:hypothetical protein